MFTGIVQGKAKVASITQHPDLISLQLAFPQGMLENLKTGASIAVNGTCLTVVEFDSVRCRFDVMQETLRLTNLGGLHVGDEVNFERAARFGDEIGGHLMSGHIHATTVIEQIERSEHNCTLWLKAPAKWRNYLLPKGFVGLNGCSLTLGEVTEDRFSIHLIPETLKTTTFGQLVPGDRVNLEIDHQTQVIVDTVERLTLRQPHTP